jgi:hypothetical protein
MSRAALDRARVVADAVLHEGYLLYPYRASSAKNQVRWQFGVLGPVGASAAGAGEEPSMRVECLLEPGPEPVLDLRLRFLQLQARTVEQATADGFEPVRELRAGPSSWLSWDEAVDREIDLGPFRLRDLLGDGGPLRVPVHVTGGEDLELLHAGGRVVGRLRRWRWPLHAQVELVVTGEAAARPLMALTVRLDNVAEHPPGGDRDEAHRRSLLTAHLVLALDGGAFCSAIDPPAWAAARAAACDNRRCWPVLVGAEGQRDVVLASPIILDDRPQIAAESAGELFDATEIDEILTLRVMTMTEDEKREARATDPRAAAILDRCGGISPADLQRLHGARREVPGPPVADEAPWWDPGTDASVSPETDAVEVAGVAVARGSRVRVHPARRADAQDMFFADQEALVTGVLHDVDGQVHVAVVLADDPASDLHGWYGRYFYFAPEELEPLEATP